MKTNAMVNTHSLLSKGRFQGDFKPGQALDFNRVLHAINPRANETVLEMVDVNAAGFWIDLARLPA